MLPFLGDKYGNPSSMHRFGGGIRKHVDTAREQVAALLNASPQEIFFTGCGSESDNLAIQGFCSEHGSPARLVTSTVEHPAVRNCCRVLARNGIPLWEIGVDKYGLLDMDALAALPGDVHTLITLMWANNETGVLFPIEQIAVWAKEKGCALHTDAVQAVGKIPIDLQKVPVDLLAVSGHKLRAPKGVGALFVRSGVKIAPLMHGGHQEHGLRAGTENVPCIVGLGRACELAVSHMKDEGERVRSLRDRLERELLSRCKGAKVNGHDKQRLPNTLNISFENIEGEAILLLLDEYGIAASSGSACTTGSLEPSHVMQAMGVPYSLAHSSTRFSLSACNSEADIEKTIDVMPGIVDRLRELSPFV